MQDQAPDLLHVLLLLPTAVATFAVKFLRDMALAVNRLSETFAVVVSRVDSHDDKIGDHEQRIRKVELD